MRKSRFYKKYEMIDKLLKSQKVPPHFQGMTSMLFVMFIVMIIYLSLVKLVFIYLFL